MKIVFISNILNHHQTSFCENMQELCEEFFFIATDNSSTLGYQKSILADYLLNYYKEEQKAKCIEKIKAADVIIIGSAPISLVKFTKKDVVIFRYSERPLKKGLQIVKYIPRLIKWHITTVHPKKTYMLCASAYTAYDYRLFGMYKNRTYKWGYFPQAKTHDIDALLNNKEKNLILWAGRFLDWKHPDLAISVAKKLKIAGYNFNLNIIGDGQLKEQLERQILENNLADCVHLLGSMKPEQVRGYMEKSQIYLFTSDFNEGWGAVLNEAMNSGCAIVASHAIGSVPFLLEDGKNGYIYKNGQEEDLFEKTKLLLDSEELCKEVGKNAYLTILNEWNAKIAAQRFVSLYQEIKEKKTCNLFEEGPCSKAQKIKNRWYKKIKI